MNSNVKSAGALLAAAGLLALVSGCSDSGEASGSANTPIDASTPVAQAPATGTPVTATPAAPAPAETQAATTPPVPTAALMANDFSFPAVTEANGTVSVEAPSGPLPTFSARRLLTSGTGSTIGFGDPVVLRYSMYSWSSGELVETTDAFDEPITIEAGVTEGVPDYLTKSLLGRNLGDKIQVVFEAGMEDLPSYLDNNDAYILVIDLI